MRRITIAVVVLALLGGLNVISPLSAQVDPCKPVTVPKLCKEVDKVTGDDGPKKKPPKQDDNDGPGPGGNEPSSTSQKTDKARDKSGGGKKGSKIPFTLAGPQNTERLMTILSKLIRYGVPLKQSILEVAGPFPVAGLAWWTNDWHACRDGCTRFHEGLDIFARTGTPLVAAADGVVSQKGIGELAGLYVEITDDQGVQYFYAHMSKFVKDLQVGDHVSMGQIVGYLGNTGNAIFTPAHVHFEYQPDGIPAPPKPLVDRWLKIAEHKALDLLAQHSGKKEPLRLEDLDTFRLTRLFDLAGESVAPDTTGTQLLLLAGLQPAASSLEIARQTVDEMSWEIDWAEQADAQLGGLVQDYNQLLAQEALMSAPLMGTFPAGGEPATGTGHSFDPEITGSS